MEKAEVEATEDISKVKLQGIKVVGKIDLDTKKKKEATPEEKASE